MVTKKKITALRQAEAALRENVTNNASAKKSKRVGNFEIICKIGEGGMGTVFKARQISIDREVALKILAPGLAKESDFQERFFREARAVAKFNHPNIVAGIDVGKSNGVYYFAMEYIAGQSLGQRLKKQGRLPEKEALEFARQTALALQHAHTHHLLHRDVKPDNILIDSTGVAKLADLGLVRTRQGDEEAEADGASSDNNTKKGDANLTRKGKAIGTPYYISPEQARGKKDLTPGTDLYSLGATLYHLLVGEQPFPGSSGQSVMRKHVKNPVPDPRTINPKISSRSAEIVMRLMQKKPKDRFQSGQQLAVALEEAMADLEPKKAESKASTKAKAKPRKTTPSKKKMTTAAAAIPKPPQPAIRGTRIQKKPQNNSTGILIGGVVLAGITLFSLFLMITPTSPRVIKKPEKRSTPTQVVKRSYKKANSVKPKQKRLKPTLPEIMRPVRKPAQFVEPIRPEEQAWQPKPEEKISGPIIKTQPKVIEPADEKKLMLAVFEALRKSEFKTAEAKVEHFLQTSENLETVRFYLDVINQIKMLDQKWNEHQNKLAGEQVTIDGFIGKVTKVTHSGFIHDLGSGASRIVKWETITGVDRLRIMGFIPNEADSAVQQGMYLYVRGHPVPGARALLTAHKNGKLAAPPTAWKLQLEGLVKQALESEMKTAVTRIEGHYALRQWLKVIGGVELFRKSFGTKGQSHEAQIGTYYQEARIRLERTTLIKDPDPTQTKEPASPGNKSKIANKKKVPEKPKVFIPPSIKFVARQFRGRVDNLSNRLGHIRITYDFSIPKQQMDFTTINAEMERKGPGDLRFTPGPVQKTGLGGALIHKAQWMGDGANFRIVAEVFVLKEGQGFGAGIREKADATGAFGVIQLGERGPSGKRLVLSQLNKRNQASGSWNYKVNAVYRCLLMKKGEYWTARLGERRQNSFSERLVARQKRKDLPGEFSGYGMVFSNGAKLIIRKVIVEGYLHPEYIKKLAMGSTSVEGR